MKYAFICLLLLVAPVKATITFLPDLNQTNLNTFLSTNVFAEGDTVVLPAGTARWTTHTLLPDKELWLMGQGTNATIIIPDHALGLATLYYDGFSVNRKGRISHIQFSSTGDFGVVGTGYGMIQYYSGRSHQMEIDHCLFDRIPGKIIVGGTDFCVRVGECTFINDSDFSAIPITVGHRNWNGANDNWGHASWSSPMSWGTTNCWVIENCYASADVGGRAFTDCEGGTRIVVRYCTLINCHADCHGTESSSYIRGGLHFEYYNNYARVDVSYITPLSIRSGSVMMFSNTFEGFQFNGPLLQDYQATGPFDYGGWNGTNQFCSNTVALITGTHTGTNGSLFIEDGTKTWTNNTMVYHTAQNLSILGYTCHPDLHPFGMVRSNTATRIYFYPNFFSGAPDICGPGTGAGTNMIFNTGDSYALYFVKEPMDSPGSGTKTGTVLLDQATPPTNYVYLNEAHIPDGAGVWFWGNVDNLSNAVTMVQPDANLREGFHWTNASGINATTAYTPLVYPHPLASYLWPGETGCSYSVYPTSASHGAGATSGSFALTTSSNTCEWTAAPSAVWITITSGSSGTGDDTISYDVDSNSGADRSGTIIAGGQIFTISQAGLVCAFSIDPTDATVSSSLGTGSFDVTATVGCDWTAVSNDDWLTITGGDSGTGDGTVDYSFTTNTGVERIGTITAAGETFTITQAATSGGGSSLPGNFRIEGRAVFHNKATIQIQ